MRRVGVRKREGYSGGGGQGQGGRWINGAMATGKVSSLGFWFVGAAVAAVEGWGARGGGLVVAVMWRGCRLDGERG
jgi:hypothetical protein